MAPQFPQASPNEGVAQQVLAELGRLQIEQDIAQRMEASSGLSLAEHQAKWMVIDGKCYTYVMPYYGEIPGYTYMAVRRGSDPAAPDGYLYTVDYIPSSEASRYEFNNGLIVTYEVFSTFYNLVYFSVYLPYLQEQYGQGQAAKTTPKPGDPDFMESTEGQGKYQGPGLEIKDKQFGKKVGKHAEDFGLDAGNPSARDWVRNRINDIFDNPTKISEGEWRGLGPLQESGNNGPGPARFYIQGNDVVVTDLEGNFVTVLKDGASNGRIVNAEIVWTQ